MNAKIYLFLLFSSIFFIHACEIGKGKDIPDVSHVPVEVDLRRFDQDLLLIDTNNMANSLPALEKEYGEFGQIFFGQILGSKDPKIATEGHASYVRGFITHPGIQKLYDTVQIVYPHNKQLESEFEQAFRFFKYYFPDQPLSGEVVTFLSEYTIAGFYTPKTLSQWVWIFISERAIHTQLMSLRIRIFRPTSLALSTKTTLFQNR